MCLGGALNSALGAELRIELGVAAHRREQPLPTCRKSLGNDLASIAGMSQMEYQIGARQRAAGSFRPFDEDQRRIDPQIAETEPLELAGVGDAVEIEMMSVALADAIRLDEAVRRTLHAFTHTERRQQCSRKSRFTGAEIAFEVNHAAVSRRNGKTRSELAHADFIDASGIPACAVHGSEPLTRLRSGANRSLASKPRGVEPAAKSPARACNATPTHAASHVGNPCASSAATTPVKTSP